MVRFCEKEPEPWTDHYSDMNSMEKSMLLDEVFALHKAGKEREAKLLEKLDRMAGKLLSLNENSQAQIKVIDELKQIIASQNIQIEKLQKENTALKEQKKLDKKHNSQKTSVRKQETSLREEDRDNLESVGQGVAGWPTCQPHTIR